MTLLLLNLAQYQRNNALRAFAKKRVKEYFKTLVTQKKNTNYYKNRVYPTKSSLDLSEKKNDIDIDNDVCKIGNTNIGNVKRTFHADSLFGTEDENNDSITFFREPPPARSLFEKRIFIEKPANSFNEEIGESGYKLTLENIDESPFSTDMV